MQHYTSIARTYPLASRVAKSSCSSMLRRECNITPNNDGFRPEADLGRTSVKRIPPSSPLVHRRTGS